MKRFLWWLFPVLAMASSSPSLHDLDGVWTNQNGESVTLSDFRGKPVVICMFFSHCGYACPRITADMKKIAAGITTESQEQVAFVMASFDDVRDTPETLRLFAAAKELDASWSLLHGDADTVRMLAAALDVRYRKEDDGNFAHANKIMILDAEGRLVYQREGLGGDLDPAIDAVKQLIDP